MFNYAYKVGRLVKIGSAVSAPQKKKELQVISGKGALIYGVDKADVTDLWIRDAGIDRHAYAIESMLRNKFKDVSLDNDWFIATDPVLSFFGNLNTNLKWANEWCTAIVKLKCGE